MAWLYIAEYNNLGQIPNTGAQMPQEPPIAEQRIAITGGSLQSAAFNTKTRAVRLNTDAPCSILFGTNPTAANTNQRLSPNQTEYKGVPEGGGFMVAVIMNT